MSKVIDIKHIFLIIIEVQFQQGIKNANGEKTQ
jgi:hypothetical protein